MKIYITRHGQVEPNAQYWGQVSYPKGEVPLSEMGRKQAQCLGRRLKELHFTGKILSSPYLRTMETAELIAMETGSKIFPFPGVREIFKTREAAQEYRGSTLKELRQQFTQIADEAQLQYPWWEPKQEDYERVRYRVALAMEEIRKEDKDVLIVGHGASAIAAMHYVFAARRKDGWLWNCGLTMFDTKNVSSLFINCTKHMPYHMISNNKELLKDRVYDIEIPEMLHEEKGVKLLHIGDTFSATYPWYRSLIKALKPDVIVHTGDSADEVKVGRMPETRQEYLDKVQYLLDILEESGSKVYWIPGNNDLPLEVAQRAPFMEILQPDTVIDVEGTDICVAHSGQQITKKADIYLYGHSARYEVWSDQMNTSESNVWYLNAIWNTYVCVLPKRSLFRFGRPDKDH